MQPRISQLLLRCALILLCTFAFAGSTYESLCEIAEDEFTRVLELSFHEFDQNPSDGWRPYYASECYEQAAQLLTTYIDRYTDGAGLHYMLPFHAGQMLALSNEYEAAAEYMRRAYSQSSRIIDWNAFVDANIAFLHKDRETLLRMRERIAEQPEMTEAMGASKWAIGKKMNLDVVDGFIACFDESYAVAYGDECRGN